MKLLKKLKLTIPLLVMLISGLACDHLTLEPQQSISNSTFFKSIGDFTAAVAGGYNQMQSFNWAQGTVPLVSDMLTGDIKQSPQCNRWQEFSDYEGAAISGHQYEVGCFNQLYSGINQMNMIINNEWEAPATATATLTQLKGEAYAIRALALFDLTKMWGQHYTFTADASHPGVAIVLEFDAEGLPSRSTVAQCYAQVISDFNMAISMMSTSRGGKVMWSVQSVQAMLSRVYLYMEDYTNAKAMADAVINSGNYALLPRNSYLDMFVTGETSEAILEISNSEVDGMGGTGYGGMVRKSGYGDYLPSKDILNLIDPDDIRAGITVFDPDLSGDYASQRINKWPTVDHSDNYPVVRFAEMYLNRAEANYHLGNEAAALADINMLRERAFGDSDHNIASTGAALLADILLERRIELAFEGHGIHDLARYKKDVIRIDYTGDQGTVTYPNNFMIFPVPRQELDVNPNFAQNAGY